MIRDEFLLIETLAKYCPTSMSGVRVGIGDDAAIVTPPAGWELVVTTDSLTEEVHFFRDASPRSLGWKLAAVNFSDLAAMGAEAYGLLVALAVPRSFREQRLRALYAGLGDCLLEYGAVLLGGDTVATHGSLTLTATALGWVPHGSAVTRAGAQPGDRVVVTGATGYPALALAYRQRGLAVPKYWREKQELPCAQLTQGRALRLAGATAMNDISDGLGSELWEIAVASRVSLAIRSAALPCHEEINRYARRIGMVGEHFIFNGGEDFELVATLPSDVPIPAGVTEIGTVDAGTGVYLDGRPLDKGGYNHFGGHT